ETFSNQKGHFYKGGLTPGNYKVTVEKEGYFPVSGSVRVSLGETAKINIKLESHESTIPESLESTKKGEKLLDAGKYKEAIQQFSESISKDKSNPLYFYYRGGAYEKNGNNEQALEDYQKAVELKPDFILPITRTAKIYAEQKNYEKAIDYYKKAVELGDENKITYYNYGVCLLNLGNNQEAKKIFEKLISFDENYADAYYHLGIIHIGLNEAEKAKEYLWKFIDLDPENKNAETARKILENLNFP
ncbi:MAG TPA: tetratricopeptide repeat protein, partial [Acidobacteriota bacterium]|nr:tetratricopeptide repeat protein [Acidobacteriota bacterium]